MQGGVLSMSPEEVYRFAHEEVFSSLRERYETRRFSRSLWKRMAQAGLFGFLIPPQYGGSGRGPDQLLPAVEAFLQGGRDLGLCLSWLDHLLIHAHVIGRFGTEGQKQKFLPGLVTGDRIGALAASEPETGANPVKMRARAEREDGTYRISGHKTFITNGPVADLIIVLARTGPTPGKEGISAFLLETGTAGFRVEQEMDFGFLRTSPHGELLFEGCSVPVENLLGREGDGHVRISRAVFGWERFLVAVALTAHLSMILQQTLGLMAVAGASPDGETRKRVAGLHVTLEGLREFASGLACEVLDRDELDRRLIRRLLFLVRLLNQCRDELVPLCETVGGTAGFPLGILLEDARLLDVGKGLYELQTGRLFDTLVEKVSQTEI
jgi:isovaleryl-CoA dehydrogenase